MSARSLAQFGAAPVATINLTPNVGETGQALTLDFATGTYSPFNPIAATPITGVTLTLAGNATTTGPVPLTVTSIAATGGNRLVTIQFPPTATGATNTGAPSFTGAISDLTLAPVTNSVVSAIVYGPTTYIPVTLTISTAGQFTATGLVAMAAEVHSIGFCVTYLAKPPVP